ncbi:MAG: CoA transferase, partial [Rhodospirillales bacterium]
MIEPSNNGPLAGLRVIDLTRILAGPFCTMNLGDMGAEIIKIERPALGDDTRRWGPPFIEGEAAYFLGIN